MKLALCQINTSVGDFEYNAKKILDFYQDAVKQGCDLAIFPELTICGYPPQDLVEDQDFLNTCNTAVTHIIKATQNQSCGLLIGAPIKKQNKVFNSALLINDGKIIHCTEKLDLPNYGVFDEKRVFSKGKPNSVITFKNKKIGILICEDAWSLKSPKHLLKQGAEIFIAINSSPFDSEKHKIRKSIAKRIIKSCKIPLVYVNQYGAQDSIIFDGGSFILDKNNQYLISPKFWEERMYVSDLSKSTFEDFLWKEEEHIYQAIMTGIKNYGNKNGFSKVILGISGGIDSALVASIATDALGNENVKGYRLPSMYSSTHSLKDAEILAKNLEIEFDTLPISDLVEGSLATLKSPLKNSIFDLTEQNLQARIRGILLMAISNNTNSLLLTTGNKSEYAAGYATLYGDMCGAYAPIKDIYKTQVYKLAKWRNANIPLNSLLKKLNVIPKNSISKAPSAELKPDQRDQDSLPPYNVLDKILYHLIEKPFSIDQFMKKGFNLNLVKKIKSLLKISEYKRRQSAPGPKISIKDLDKERRYPITNRF
jgi:NAD+ synthase